MDYKPAINDLWFTLKAGQLHYGPQILEQVDAAYTVRLRLTQSCDMKNIKIYREELHRLLDKAIERISK